MKGTLLDDDGVRKAFEFDLDRSGDNAEQVGEAMQRSLAALKRSLARSGITPTDWTEYVYKTDETVDADELESEFPFDAIPYILVFDDNVETIELRLWEKHVLYERAETKELDTGRRLMVIAMSCCGGARTKGVNGLRETRVMPSEPGEAGVSEAFLPPRPRHPS